MPVEKRALDASMGMIPDEELVASLRDFDRAENWTVLPFLSVDEKVIATNRKSETARKAIVQHDGESFVLKEFPWYCSDEAFIEFTLSFQQHLRDAGVPIPRFEERRDGRRYTRFDDDYLFMQEYVTGSSWTAEPGQARSVGRALADLHEQSAAARDAIASTDRFHENVFELADGMVDIVRELLRDNRESLPSGDVSHLERYVETVEDVLATRKQSATERGYDDVRIPVHGDYNPWNVIFDERDEVAAIIDFDNATVDNPAHDVAEGLLDHSFIEYRGKTTRFDGVPDRFDERLAAAFLDGYCESAFAETVEPYLADVASAVYLELASLGAVRGDFEFADLERIVEKERTVHDRVKELVRG
jgi:Ser/Thr protein kinase RdoA (MazF antagonist)